MKVMKFGGTSVGSPERMKGVAQLITKSGEPTFVVLSAMSGTTNSLVEISDYLYKKNPEGANEVINNLEKKYMLHIEQLYSTDEYKEKTREFLTGEFNYLRSFTKDLFTSFEEKTIVAQGEIMSTNMMVNYLQEQGVKAVLLSALDFMRTDKNAEPDLQYIKEKLKGVMDANADQQIYLTQGFICRNAYGEIDNLQRGGSDYHSSVRHCLLTRSKFGPTSTACITMTPVWLTRQRPCVSLTSRKLPSSLILVRRSCILPACSLPSMPAFPYA